MINPLFASHWYGFSRRIQQLSDSLARNQPLFPLSAQSVSMMQEQIFKDIALYEQEEVAHQSNRDKALLMEKIGAIPSTEVFGTVTILRNKFAHHYPEDTVVQIERLNLIVEATKKVLEIFDAIERFLLEKKLIAPVCKF